MIVPKYTREIPQRYRLEAGKCGCGYVAFPPRLICPECGSRTFEPINLTPEGTILSWTIVHVPAEEFNAEAPLPIAIIETPEGARLTAQVVDGDPEAIEIGAKVKLMLRRVRCEGHAGIHQYAYKAILV